MIGVRRHGLTVVEVLVALAVFALLAAATAGVLSMALRLQGEAGRVAQRISAFGPVAAGIDPTGTDATGTGATGTGATGTDEDGTDAAVAPPCEEASDEDGADASVSGGLCLYARTRCRVTADGAPVCDGHGPLLRSDWAWSGPGGGPVAAVTAWRWAP